MAIWKQEISVEIVTKRNQNSLASHMQIDFVKVGDDFLKAKMPILQNALQPAGIMHGGASCVLAETVASTAANYCITSDYCCVGIGISTNHIKSIKSGFVYATAKPMHLGRTTHVWSIDICNENDKKISVSTLTLLVIKSSFS